MGLYKSGQPRFSKWLAKYVPETVAARFTQVRDVAASRAQEGLIMYASMQELVRPILDKHGVAGPDRAKYLGFANKLLKHVLRTSGDGATNIATGLKSLYTTAFNADPAVLDEIIEVVCGWVVVYG